MSILKSIITMLNSNFSDKSSINKPVAVQVNRTGIYLNALHGHITEIIAKLLDEVNKCEYTELKYTDCPNALLDNVVKISNVFKKTNNDLTIIFNTWLSNNTLTTKNSDLFKSMVIEALLEKLNDLTNNGHSLNNVIKHHDADANPAMDCKTAVALNTHKCETQDCPSVKACPSFKYKTNDYILALLYFINCCNQLFMEYDKYNNVVQSSEFKEIMNKVLSSEPPHNGIQISSQLKMKINKHIAEIDNLKKPLFTLATIIYLVTLFNIGQYYDYIIERYVSKFITNMEYIDSVTKDLNTSTASVATTHVQMKDEQSLEEHVQDYLNNINQEFSVNVDIIIEFYNNFINNFAMFEQTYSTFHPRISYDDDMYGTAMLHEAQLSHLLNIFIFTNNEIIIRLELFKNALDTYYSKFIEKKLPGAKVDDYHIATKTLMNIYNFIIKWGNINSPLK